MTTTIDATCEVAKNFSVKREKGPEDVEIVVAHLKVADVMLDRDQLDEIVGLPIGWSSQALYDDQGAPLRRLTLVSERTDLTLTGVIKGGDKPGSPSLTLRDAEVSGITLDLVPLGALLSCGLAWRAAGDEVDDIADLLGKLCGIHVTLSDGGQGDLLSGVNRPLRALQDVVDRGGIDSIEILDGEGNSIGKIEKSSARTRGAA